MHQTPDQLVQALVVRAGSVSAAAEISGISRRILQRWVAGRAKPTPSSIQRILMTLDGDERVMRRRRIEFYATRAEQQEDLFA